jgi:hypothetical protein
MAGYVLFFEGETEGRAELLQRAGAGIPELFPRPHWREGIGAGDRAGLFLGFEPPRSACYRYVGFPGAAEGIWIGFNVQAPLTPESAAFSEAYASDTNISWDAAFFLALEAFCLNYRFTVNIAGMLDCWDYDRLVQIGAIVMYREPPDGMLRIPILNGVTDGQ